MAKKGKKGGFLKGALLGAGAAVAADQLLKKQGSSLGEKLGDVGEKLGLDGAAEKVGEKLSGVGEKIGLGRKDEADKCPNCGAKIGPADRFCAVCGKPVTTQKAVEQAEAAKTAEAAPTPMQQAAAGAPVKSADADFTGSNTAAGAAVFAAGAAEAAPKEPNIPSELDAVRAVLARQLEGLRGFPPAEEDIEAAVERYKQGLPPIDPAEMEAAFRKAQAEAEAALEKAKQEGRPLPTEEEINALLEKESAEINAVLARAEAAKGTDESEAESGEETAAAAARCPECGAELKPESKFCDSCGAPVK